MQDEIWESRVLRMRQFSSRGLKESWPDHRQFFGASFVRFFETEVLEAEFSPNRVWDDAPS